MAAIGKNIRRLRNERQMTQDELAEKLYERALERCRSYVPETEHGVFGAEMEVSLVNDGPFTLVLDSDTLFKKK